MTNIIRLVDDSAGAGNTYIVDYKWTTYRFLLSNGNIIDVRAVTNDSWVSTEILKVVNGLDKLPDSRHLDVTIVGHCALPEPAPAEEEKPAPRKRPAKKRAAATV